MYEFDDELEIVRCIILDDIMRCFNCNAEDALRGEMIGEVTETLHKPYVDGSDTDVGDIVDDTFDEVGRYKLSVLGTLLKQTLSLVDAF